MVNFELGAAHPEHAEKIEALVRGFLSKYPWCPLRRVRLYEPDEDDRSLGNADEPGEIALNAIWFSQPPEVLQREALDGVMVPIDGEVIPWHLAVMEPAHVAIHEMVHIMSDVLPGWEEIIEPFRLKAVEDPGLAPSGYALAGPAECLAELGCNCELGLARPHEIELFEEVLALRKED